MRNLRLHDIARQDYAKALAWHASLGGNVAAKFDAAFHRAIDAICFMPEAFGMIDGRHRWCRIKRSSYGVVYRVTPDEIVVVGVPHNRQQAADWGSRG